MNMSMYVYGALLVIVALLLLIVPMLKHRSQASITLSLSALIVMLPVAVILIYLSVSTYNWEADNDPNAAQGPDVSAMVERLAARMDAEPDLEGLTMLSRSYSQLGQFSNAADTWHKAWVLTEGKDPQVALNYAEALILADQRTLRTGAADLLDDVLLAIPNDPRALWYGGLSSAARGDKEIAAQRWSRLLQSDELPEDARMAVQTQLAALSMKELPPGEQAVSEGAAATVITANISITPELNEQVNRDGSARLFLIARDVDNPRPPVAVKRLRVADFPVSINISDNDVMVPGRKLADIVNLEIIARVSQTGGAFATPGDLYGDTAPQTDDAGSLSATITINKVVE
jgi:cytochrome c-type biogenesis protein CcmH